MYTIFCQMVGLHTGLWILDYILHYYDDIFLEYGFRNFIPVPTVPGTRTWFTRTTTTELEKKYYNSLSSTCCCNLSISSM